MKYIKLFIAILLVLFLVGCNTPQIEEPTVYHEVTFIGKYGDVIEKVKVEEGKKCIAPDAPKVKYYEFTNWDQDISSVKNDMIVNAIYKRGNDEFLTNDPNYWLRLLSEKFDITKTLMTSSEIDEYNKNVINGINTKVVNVLNVEKVISSEKVKQLINSYNNMEKYVVYHNESKEEITTLEKSHILSNRNLENLSDDVEVKFGLICNFAHMRSYPTNHYSSTYERDRFQETSLNVGEAVAVYHTSLDGRWSFVQANNYYGWVESKYIGIGLYDEIADFITKSNRLVVISDYVVIENAFVRMGQSFPLINDTDKYEILFPRILDGRLNICNLHITKSSDYSKGYLEYNYENLYKQAFKLLNINYSWGDKEKDGRDCSSTQNAIYSSFGFILPRNTSNQNAIPTYGTNFSSITVNELKENYLPGTLIFSSGHVMMYIGENAQGYSYILHNTSSGRAKCILERVDRYGINKIIGTLKLQ